MTTNEKMEEYRKNKNLSLKDMSKISGVSEHLLRILEEGGTTTPKLVPKIVEAYELSELEGEDLMAEHLRPHSENYDPYKYVSLVDIPISAAERDEFVRRMYQSIKAEEEGKK